MKTWNGHERFTYATHKIDGWTLRIEKGPGGSIVATSRTGRFLDVAHCSFMEPIRSRVPNGCTLIGELHAPGQCASAVPHYIANRLDLAWTVFAVPTIGGMDLSREPLDTIGNIVRQWGLTYAQWERFEDRTSAAWLARIYGFEGWVFKNCNHDPDSERKLKPVLTADCRVVGLNDGKGKYAGMVGSLVCADDAGNVVANVGGMDDRTRSGLGKSTIGRIVEVAYQYIGPNGKLRHPRFVRWRMDKVTP